jgi:hypothetical protein
MAGFGSFQEIGDTDFKYGRYRIFTFRKIPSQISTAGIWFDLSLSPGNPVPQYYAASPLVSVQMKQSTDGGVFHGSPVTPYTKHIRQTALMCNSATPLPMAMILCDYLLYYPFIDEGTTDEQLLTNSLPLPRYADGAGVQIMAVSVAGRTGGQTFRCTYTNSDGVAGRVTGIVIQNTAAANGHIVSTQTANALAAGPFMPLQEGDTGVRSIDSTQMISGPDVGLFTLVLVKPICQTQIRGIDAPVEVDHLVDKGLEAPQIVDDAYLNWLCLPNGSLSINGYLATTWN